MPKNKRADNIEKSRRIGAVQDSILSGHSHDDIVASLIVKWELSERQARRYVAEAYEAFALLTGHGLKKRRGWHIAARLKILKANSQKPKLQLDILDSIAKIEGVMVHKIDHTTNGDSLNDKKAIIKLSSGVEIEL